MLHCKNKNNLVKIARFLGLCVKWNKKMENSLKTVVAHVAISLVLAGLSGAALYFVTDFATRGVIV